MVMSLYDTCVPGYTQTLGAVSGLLDKGLEFCEAQGIAPSKIVEHRIAPDMLPFRFQIVSIAHHSQGAIHGVADGKFMPPNLDSKEDYAALQKLILDAQAAVGNVDADIFNSHENGMVEFHLGKHVMPFTVSNFISSFSLPNLYFHTSMAYAILRGMGVPLGKTDYLGALRINR